MKNDNDWKQRLGVVYSTNPDFQYQTIEENEPDTLEPSKQRLTVSIDRRQRAGKQVTLVKGFVGRQDDLASLAKTLKTRCGVGGTAKDGEIYAYHLHISPYEQGNIFNRDPDRPKRLLMHKREIRKLFDLQKQDGYSLIPLSLYFKNGRVKVELGLCKGKKNYDKRQSIAERDAKREMDRARKEHY